MNAETAMQSDAGTTVTGEGLRVENIGKSFKGRPVVRGVSVNLRFWGRTAPARPPASI
jgi:hypothetical protein